MTTWQNFIDSLEGVPTQALAQVIRDSYSAEGQPVGLAQFLASDSMAVAAWLSMQPQAIEGLSAMLRQKLEQADSYPSFVAQFELPERALAQLYADRLQALDVPFAGASAEAWSLLELWPSLGEEAARYWDALVQAFRSRNEKLTDQSGRQEQLLNSIKQPALQSGIGTALNALQQQDPYASLASIAQTPVNQLALSLWPAGLMPLGTYYLEQFIALAEQLSTGNYTADEEQEKLISSQPAALQKGLLALLGSSAFAEVSADELITTLGNMPVEELQNTVALLKANHPLVYGLATVLQDTIVQFLKVLEITQPLASVPMADQVLQLHLLDSKSEPFSGAGLRVVQQLASGAELPLAESYAAADGSFSVRVKREYTLADDDTMTALPTQVTIYVFGPGQPFTGNPAFVQSSVVSDEADAITLATGLKNELPAIATRPVQALGETLHTELASYLASNDLLSLADIRQAGGLLNKAEAATWSTEALEQARIIDAKVQFEIVSTDHAFAERVISEGGFYSPAEVVSRTSKDEFVALLGGTTEADREQARTFYEQTAVVSTVLQAMGLATGAELASGLAPAPEANFVIGNGAGTTGPVGPVGLGPLTSYVPGTDTTRLYYSPDGQCDCPACRSAVSPTAYLASLLNYAASNLRNNAATVSAQQLQDTLLQPFCDLPVSCQYAEQSVCRYRLIIEVLRKHLRVVSSASTLLAGNFRPYLTAVYEALAEGAGTSAQEIAQATTSASRKALAARMGITPGTVSFMQAKFNSIPDNRLLSEVEANLEECFGLISTSPARDPLSTGMVVTPASPVVRLTLQGAQWGINVAQTGTVTVQVLLEAGKPDRLLVHRNNDTSPDEVVASGQLVADAAPATTYRAVLYPQHDSGLRGSAVINGPLAGLTGQTYMVRVIPRLTADRLRQLETGWQEADFAAKAGLFNEKTVVPFLSHVPSWNGYQFLIDPDIIGPDDFRPGAAGGVSATTGRVYAIWAQRLNFLQAQFISAPSYTLNNWVDRLVPGFVPTYRITYNPVGAAAGTGRVAWDIAATAYNGRNLSGSDLLDVIQADLIAVDAERAANALDALNILGMSPEALARLNELRTKTGLTAEEKEEGRQILRQTLKKSFEAAWADEETSTQNAADVITLSGKWFQRAVHEPIEGRWFPAPTLAGLEYQVVDPQEMTPLDLPDPGIGDAVAVVWRHRAALLTQVQQAIFAVGVPMPTAADRSNAMLQYAFSGDLSLPIVLAAPYLNQAPYDTLEELSAGFKDLNYVEHGRVVAFVTDVMGLTAAELDHLIDLRSQATAFASESIWQEMAALLARGWKRAIAIRPADFSVVTGTVEHGWYNDYPLVDRNLGPTNIANAVALVYKQKLVKWRASAVARAKWVAALGQAALRPLIDPDQLVPGDFHQAGKRLLSDPAHFVNPAFELYYQRDQALNGSTGLYAKTGTDWSDNGSVLGIASVLRVPPTYLTQLYDQYLAKVDVADELARLNLTSAGLTLLATFGPNQAAEVRHLLVQVQRERIYADWSREEVALGIYQSPLYFRQVGAESTAPNAQAKPWRTSVLAWRAWHQDLAARYDQADTMAAATQQAVKAAEDQCLPLLRDALADAVTVPNNTLATRPNKLAYLSSRYLLDFEIACCQDTTRVGQAIEVLQKLFFNLENGLSDATHDLTLASGVAATFPQAWQWLSSYEQWRSLMFLYLYPQNVLLPSLKPNQTSQFRQIVSGIRQNAQITPADACGYMHDYQAYADELNTLKVAASVETYLETKKNGCFVATTEARRINMQVALSSGHIAYANVSYLDAASMPPVWNALPGSLQVERVVGCAAYVNDSNERHAYVFVFLRTDPKSDEAVSGVQPTVFAFQRFNLQSLSWDDDYTQADLDGEGTVELTNVQITSGTDETWAPIVVGLRNRRPTITSEYPLSIANSTATPTSTVGAIMGNVVNDVDLFFAQLNIDGKRLRPQGIRKIWMVGDISLLQAITLEKDAVFTLFNVASVVTGGGFSAGSSCIKSICSKLYLMSSVYDKNILDRELLGNITWYFTNSATQFARTIAQRIQTLYNFNATPAGFFGCEFMRRVEDYQNNAVTLPLSTTQDNYWTGIGAKMTGYRTGNPDGNTYDVYLNRYYKLTNAYNVDVTQKLTIIIRNIYTNGIVSGTNALTPMPDRYEYVGPIWRPALPGAAATTAGSATNTVQYKVALLPSGSWQTQATVTPAAGGTARSLHQTPLNLPALLSAPTELAVRRSALSSRFPGTSIADNSYIANLANEAYLALPLLLAGELLKGKYFDEALQYFRLIYDYTRLSATERFIYPGLQNAIAFTSITDWLADPENPYLLAGLRENSQLQFVVMNVARALLAYADSEFSRDTVESVAEARSFYELAGRLLQQDIIQYDVQTCASILDPLDGLVDAGWQSEWLAMKDVLATVNQRVLINYVVSRARVLGTIDRGLTWIFAQAKAGLRSWADSFDLAWALVDSTLNNLRGTYDTLATTSNGQLTGGRISNALASQLQSAAASATSSTTQRPYVPFLGTAFCIPTNPIPYSYQLHAALGLYKIRTCRNISGIQRQLEAYAAPTDTTTGMPSIGTNGQLMQSGRLVIPATQYRYAYIVERAKQVVSLAQQAEAAFLAALEKRDAEAYNLLKAKQDIAVSRANIQLQDLRVREAEDGIDLAQLQLDRSQFMMDQYSEWLGNGLNDWEKAELTAIVVSGAAKAVASLLQASNVTNAFFSAGGSVAIGIANAAAAVADATVQFSSAQATFERRNNEWTFQRDLANKDVRINQEQITIAHDQLNVVGQEKKIAQLQLDHSQAVVSFLNTKFTNAELYAWMSQILQGAYSYFLQQATSLAKLAELQLAFERQEVPVNIIQQDYWSSPAEDSGFTSSITTTTTDRKGLTGSTRLLQDVTRLDVYAFETNRRKLQLTKTVSLAQSFPTEFVRFRDTGVLSFACPQTWFDQDFPGHYLRTISRVRTSVIALVPPVDGIKARLGTAGLSRVTVAGTPFQSLTLPRQPEGVALTSAQNATGIFELNQQSEMLYPFEGLGVDVPWSFSLQKAANPSLDYESIADVLLTLEYTALEDYDYARQIIPQLGTERTQVVALSFRNRFADQWYDLHHAPDLAPDDRYLARFNITAADLPRNLANLRLKNLSIYVDAPLDDTFTDRTQLTVGLRRDTGNGTGTSATAVANRYGLISTKTGLGAGSLYTGNAAALVPLLRNSPVGDWVLTAGTPSMTDALRERLANNQINDIYLIMEVTGDAPAYALL